MRARSAGVLVAGLLTLVFATTAVAKPSGKVIVERDVEYGRTGDRPLVLDILRPAEPAAKPLPVICFIHGGGWVGGNKAAGHGLLQAFAASGNYFCVSVGYRLSGEATWPAQIHDCKAAIRWLRANAEKYGIDPQRIGVWGASAGGHLVSLLGTSGGVKELEGQCGSPEQSSRVTCVVNFFGPTDLVAAAKDPGTPKAVVGLFDKLLGEPIEKRQDLGRQASPVTYVTKDDAPTLTMHGTKDPLVPLAQAKLLDAALRKAGVESTLVVIEGGGHGFGGPEVGARLRAFFDRHLRGKEVEVSAEPIQLDGGAKKP